MSRLLSVEITQDVIETATQRDSRHCMIADAIKQQYPHLKNVLVDIATIRWSNPRTQLRYVALTPEKAARALVEFDKGQKVEPFLIHLDVIQRTKLKRNTRVDPQDPKAGYFQSAKRGRKQADPKTGVIQGGKPLMMSHLSNVELTRNPRRSYGRRLLSA